MTLRVVEERSLLVRGYREIFRAAYHEVPGWHDPPMALHLARLDPRHEPIWRAAERRMWFAYQGGKAVGRLLAFVAPEEKRRAPGERVGRFAFFETVDDPGAAGELLQAACGWLREKGCVEVVGPLAFSMHDEVGLLLEGFDDPPAFMMPFNPPCAASHLTRFGFEETRAFCSYEWSLTRDQIPLRGDHRHGEAPAGLLLRAFSRRRRDQDTSALLEVYNGAFAGNWGFEPLTAEECRMFVDQFLRFGDSRLVRVAEVEGRVVGFVLTVPDPNRHLHRTRGQPDWLRLARLMGAVKLKRLRHARVITLAVRPEHRRSGVSHALIRDLAAAGRAGGYQTAELSYVDAGNTAMNTLLRGLDFPKRKRYAVYRRAV